MTAETITLVAAAILSLLFSYVPGLHQWFEPLEPTKKRLIMLALLCLVAGGSYGLACLGWGIQFGIVLTCDVAGLSGLLVQLLLAVIANQSVYAISPKWKKT